MVAIRVRPCRRTGTRRLLAAAAAMPPSLEPPRGSRGRSERAVPGYLVSRVKMSTPEEDARDNEAGAELLARHIAKDPEAFGLLLARFDSAVRSYARRVLGPEGRTHLDDATQEIWIAV